jgi:hypothetical protein
MAFLVRILILTLGGILGLWAETPPSPSSNVQPLTVRWYGQGFIYIISNVGIRIALDPFGEESVDYKFPLRLQADVVLISSEQDEVSAGDRLFGSPQIFRSTTAVGMNKARGNLFKGVETFLDNQQGDQLGENTSYSFTLDGIRFAHLGEIGHALNSEQVRQIGQVDVLFLPVGISTVSVADLRKMAADLGAKIIVPICYATIYNPKLNLRKLDDFLEGATNIQNWDTNAFTLSAKTLPITPTIYVLKSAITP